MRIEDQVCSFNLAMRLNELKVGVPSVFYYVNNWVTPNGHHIENGQHVIMSNERLMTKRKGKERGREVEFIPAYTATELADILPKSMGYGNLDYGVVLMQSFPDGKEQDQYISYYVEVFSDLDYGATVYEHSASSEADSRAGLLVKMLEYGLITIEDVCKNENDNPSDIEDKCTYDSRKDHDRKMRYAMENPDIREKIIFHGACLDCSRPGDEGIGSCLKCIYCVNK